MAHFAQIDENNIVVNVVLVADEQEHRGQEFLANDMNLGGTWLQCSYNTVGNQHLLGGTPFRGNYPGVGYKYDSELDAFIAPKPVGFPSFTLNENLIWQPPVSAPDNLGGWEWDEDSVSWVKNN